ncbi:class I SAM-dependent methyltransferase [Mycolicibacter icosiumassiliensis]|uniref:SAM-dependent methyltransferase n=1 Tax=Mycolicibacter icosiumassiliensis TaxID=1792835 RepID=UPI00082AFACD|nr:SAM-dependent methyltransferase [Mycolicibacter icosiumassiliensis]
MPESSIVVRPEPGGVPSGRLQAAGLAHATGVFEQLAATVPLPAAPRPIVVADYGAATGYNSLLPIGAAIAAFRRRTRSDHAVLVVHTDLPDNDFTALFTTLAEDPDSYTRKDTASFPSAIGRSFYAQILPSQSVNLGWTSWATMWLRRPAGQLEHSDTAAARRAYTRQAAQDWHDFVAFRGRELSPGGKLLVLTAAVDAAGRSGYRPLLDAIAAVLDEQARDGALTRDEVARMTIPVFGRSEKELRAPFAPAGRFESLTIERLEVFDAEDRFWDRYLLDRDAAALGTHWAAFVSAAVFPTLAAALTGGIDDPRAADFVHHLEAGVAARLASNPQQVQIPLALIVLSKQR